MRDPAVLVKKVCGHSDAGLLEEFRGGDKTAFDELVRRYKHRVYNVVYRFVGNHEDALDLSQEVFLRAYRGLDDYKGGAKVYTWLYRIAANLAKNRLRDRGRKGRNRGVSLESLQEAAPEAAQRAAQTEDNPRRAAERAELDAALRACLAGLPELYRTPFVLRVFDGLNYEDISKSLDCPRGTVKSRLNQARKLLRDCLKRQDIL